MMLPLIFYYRDIFWPEKVTMKLGGNKVKHNKVRHIMEVMTFWLDLVLDSAIGQHDFDL